MASSLEDAVHDADAIVLLVKHTEFTTLNPNEVAQKTKARIVIDTVNGWNDEVWKNAGFTLFRLGNNKSEI
jgi:UDP-N-acetyl-D-mannosaminuronate dehydrogenase